MVMGRRLVKHLAPLQRYKSAPGAARMSPSYCCLLDTRSRMFTTMYRPRKQDKLVFWAERKSVDNGTITTIIASLAAMNSNTTRWHIINLEAVKRCRSGSRCWKFRVNVRLLIQRKIMLHLATIHTIEYEETDGFFFFLGSYYHNY